MPVTHREGRRSLGFMAGQAQDSETTSASAATPAVTTSFAFGWQMARLYTGPLSSAAEPKLEDDLPGLSGLPAAQLVKLGLAQADVALSRVKAFLGDAQLPATDAVRAATERILQIAMRFARPSSICTSRCWSS